MMEGEEEAGEAKNSEAQGMVGMQGLGEGGLRENKPKGHG